MKNRPFIFFYSALLTACALILAACGANPASKHKDAAENTQTTKSNSTINNEFSRSKGELIVFAAASLNKVFPEIEKELLSDSGLKIKYSFEGSSTLVDQMKSGAKADVFASADEKNMAKAKAAGLLTNSVAFTSNVLTLIVPKGNPGKITGLDTSLNGKKLVVCALGVPCGNATAELTKQLGIKLTPVSEEQKVTDVRAKVETGEADAGLVYVTDAKAAGDKVEIVPVIGSEKVTNIYPIAVTKTAANPTGAKAFLAAVRSAKGQAILAKYGFQPVAKP